MNNIIPLKLTTLSPFNYGHLAIQGGVSTISSIINDRAFCFALANTIGITSNKVALPEKDYKKHWNQIPFKSSLFINYNPKILPVLARRCELGSEGGMPDRIYRATGSGNYKDFYYIQEVPPYSEFYGYLFLTDIENCENITSKQNIFKDGFITRIGSNRTGILQVKFENHKKDVILNSSTAKVFDRKLKSEKFVLNDIQNSFKYQESEAYEEVLNWRL